MDSLVSYELNHLLSIRKYPRGSSVWCCDDLHRLLDMFLLLLDSLNPSVVLVIFVGRRQSADIRQKSLRYFSSLIFKGLHPLAMFEMVP